LIAKARGIAELEDLDLVFHALAHQTRRTILRILQARGGQMTSGDIARRFDCTWPTTTRHLKILEESHLVNIIEKGRERIYVVDALRLASVAGNWIQIFELE
jgi:DNA-binding transcriptional ArsR family regulator